MVVAHVQRTHPVGFSSVSVSRIVEYFWKPPGGLLIRYMANFPSCRAPPNDRPSLISRTITRDYYAGICRRLFPPEEGYKYGLANGHTAETMNAHTGGWDYTNTTRLMWSNG